MPLYELSATVTISVYTRVEAATVEEAEAIALDRTMGHITCSSENDEAWVAHELDGELDILEITELPTSKGKYK
jgi:hypothetical protein